jgi:hypothetical protein
MLLQDVLGMHCHHILADYVTLAAAPSSAVAGGGGLSEGKAMAGLPPEAAAALRPAACALYGACTPAQVRFFLTPTQCLYFRALEFMSGA